MDEPADDAVGRGTLIGSATTLLYGEAKSGKSFLVSALITSLATGTDFLGKAVPQDRGIFGRGVLD